MMNKKQGAYLILMGFCSWLIGSLAYASYYKITFILALQDLAFALGLVLAMLGIPISTIMLVKKGYDKLADKNKIEEATEKET